MKRIYLHLFGWDETKVKIPIAKGSYWFLKSRGMRCVIGCKNHPEVVYITQKGFAHIAYCRTHAEIRVIKSILFSLHEKGIWCYCYKGKLKPLETYKETIELLDTISHLDIKKKQKKILDKLKRFKQVS